MEQNFNEALLPQRAGLIKALVADTGNTNLTMQNKWQSSRRNILGYGPEVGTCTTFPIAPSTHRVPAWGSSCSQRLLDLRPWRSDPSTDPERQTKTLPCQSRDAGAICQAIRFAPRRTAPTNRVNVPQTKATESVY